LTRPVPIGDYRKKVFGLSQNVVYLGVVSFLTDVSSEMIFTLLPLFLSNVLGATTLIIGFIEGVAETTASLLKFFSGWLSDKLGKRRELAVIGYGLSALTKPFMYIASTWGLVLGIRFTDRLGKGIRSAPRDALIADSASVQERGKAFGFHRAMDTSGAAIGLTCSAVIVLILQQNSVVLVNDTYKLLVVIGVIPAILALFVFFFIRDVVKAPQMRSDSEIRTIEYGRDKNAKADVTSLNTRFKVFLVIMFIFTLGNSSDAFLILRAQNTGNSVLHILLMLIMFNIVYALVSIPAGIISDKVGRRRIIILGWIIYVLTYLGFALVSASWQVWLLFAVYGAYYGLAEGVARAFVADLVPEERRGTAFGLFHSTVGLTLLPASLIAGWLWQTISPASAFYFGAAMALVAMIGLLVLVRE